MQSVFKILHETFILKLEKLNDCYDSIPPFSSSPKEEIDNFPCSIPWKMNHKRSFVLPTYLLDQTRKPPTFDAATIPGQNIH